jgi:hypothetical protein
VLKSTKQRVERRVHKPNVENVITGEPDAVNVACPA